MLIVDTMLYLKSDTPIQCRPPVARSQITSRENTSGETLQETTVHNTILPTNNATEVFVDQGNSVAYTGSENRFQGQFASPQIVQSPVSPETLPVPPAHLHHSQCQYSFQQYTEPSDQRLSACFGYDPATDEYLIPLAALASKNHGENIGISRLSPC